MKLNSKDVSWKNLMSKIACVVLMASSARAASTFSYTDQWTTGGQGVLRASNDTGAAVTSAGPLIGVGKCAGGARGTSHQHNARNL